MIGQGLASLGEDAGKAVQKYYYNKDTKEMLGGVTDKIAGILDTDPYIANRLGLRRDPKTNTWDKKGIAIAVTTIGGGDVRKGVQMTSGLLSDRAAQQVQNSAFLGATRPGVIMPGQQAAMYSALGGENPMGFAQYMQGQELGAAKIAETKSQTKLNLASAIAKSVAPSGFATLDDARNSVGGNLDNYNVEVKDGRFYVIPLSKKTSLEVGALETTAAGLEAGKTPQSALKAANGTPKTHKVQWTGDRFVGVPFNETERLEIKLKEGTLNEKEQKTLTENKKYANKVTSELALATVMKDQLTALSTQAANTQPGFWTTLISNIPGTPSADFAAQIDTVISKIGFDRLLQMKDSSPNGASGLGSLNASELDGLKNSLANLKKSQSYSQFQNNLKVVSDYYNNVVKSLQEDKNNLSSSGSAIGGSDTPLSPDALKYLQP